MNHSNFIGNRKNIAPFWKNKAFPRNIFLFNEKIISILFMIFLVMVGSFADKSANGLANLSKFSEKAKDLKLRRFRFDTWIAESDNGRVNFNLKKTL